MKIDTMIEWQDPDDESAVVASVSLTRHWGVWTVMEVYDADWVARRSRHLRLGNAIIAFGVAAGQATARMMAVKPAPRRCVLASTRA